MRRCCAEVFKRKNESVIGLWFQLLSALPIAFIPTRGVGTAAHNYSWPECNVIASYAGIMPGPCRYMALTDTKTGKLNLLLTPT